MKSKNQFFFLTLLLISVLIISIVNLYFIRKNQDATIETRKSLSNTISFIDSLVEQQEMMSKLDSVQVSSAGIKAPNFSLKDQNGNITTLESLGSKRKLLVFSSATCSTCKDFYSELNNFLKNHGDNAISVAVLQIDATVEENKKAIEKNNYSFDVLTANDSIFNNYKILSTPTSILVDHTNTILASGDLYTYADIVSFLEAYN